MKGNVLVCKDKNIIYFISNVYNNFKLDRFSNKYVYMYKYSGKFLIV